MKIVEPSVELLWATPFAIDLIEMTGRTCYKSEDLITDDSADKFVRMLIKRGHEAMIEHASASFKFVCDRCVSHELVRHRLASFAQESSRYCNYSKEKFGKSIGVIMPPFKMTDTSEEIWREAMGSAEAYYLELIKNGEPAQIARSVLPIGLKTEIVCTANFREWRHILKLRTSPAAHPMIRNLMIEVYNWFHANYPVIVEDIGDNGELACLK